jgi:hypothetical protein
MATRKELKAQYEQAKLRGWIPYFQSAARMYKFAVADLMGIASRESNMKNIKGDLHDGQYHGFSLMQLDIRSHREWIESGQWQDVQTAILKGAQALAEKRDQILKASKQSRARVEFSSGKTVTFTPRELTPDALRHCTLAAYNCGGASYYHYSIGNDIDRGTTGKDYGRDVIARAAVFQSFLEADGTPSPIAPSTARPAESVKQQEQSDATNDVNESAAHSQADPAIVSAEPGQDLLGAAVNSDKAKQLGGKFFAKHGSALVGWAGAMYELHKWGLVVVLILFAIAAGWVLYHNRQKLAPYVIKWLK